MHGKEKIESSIKDVFKTKETDELMVISFNNGKCLTCTPEHLLLIKNPENNDPTIIWDNGNAYKQAKDLIEKDIL